MVELKILENLCGKVLKIDPKMRSARVINNKGRLVAGGMIQGKKALEDSKQDEMLFMELALRVRMRHEFDNEFGKVKFSMSFREKVIIMSFPLTGGNVFLTSGETNLDFGKVTIKISKLVEKI